MNKLDQRAQQAVARLTFKDNLSMKETYTWEEVCKKER